MSAKSVFISYRRRDPISRLFAVNLKVSLEKKGYDVFLDIKVREPGEFAARIDREVVQRAHFVLVLVRGTLDRCAEPQDWVRREYELARQFQRNIVPIREESADLEALREAAPPCMEGVFKLRIPVLHHDSFDEEIDALTETYLSPRHAPQTNRGKPLQRVFGAALLKLFGPDAAQLLDHLPRKPPSPAGREPDGPDEAGKPIEVEIGEPDREEKAPDRTKAGARRRPPASGDETSSGHPAARQRYTLRGLMAATARERWRALILFPLFVAVACGVVARVRLPDDFVVYVRLVRAPTAVEDEIFYRRLPLEIFAENLSASAFLTEVGRHLDPPLDAARLGARVGSHADSATGIITVEVTGRDATEVMRVAAAVREQSVEVGRRLQAADAGRVKDFVSAQLAEARRKLAERQLLTATSDEELRALHGEIILLERRLFSAARLQESPTGYFRVADGTAPSGPFMRSHLLTILAAALFVGIAVALVHFLGMMLFQYSDQTIRTVSDLEYASDLPVFATLGDLRLISHAARERWAFSAWIALQDRLAYSPNFGLICGVTSSHHGDGRSTFVALLAGAARKCGFRVLTISTKPAEVSSEPVSEPDAPAREAVSPSQRQGGAPAVADLPTFTAMTASALFTPAMVTEKLLDRDEEPQVDIPLPGWTWNLERRRQWQSALSVWRKIDNVVILVELPPASEPESVLLASNLPNLAWLAERGKSRLDETREQLEMFRHARCNLVGAALNRVEESFYAKDPALFEPPAAPPAPSSAGPASELKAVAKDDSPATRDPAIAPLQPTIIENDGVLAVGEISTLVHPDVRELQRRVSDAITPVTKRIEFDLAHCGIVDSAGLGALFSVYKKAEAVSPGAVLRLLKPRPSVRRLFELVQLDQLFEIPA